MFNLERPRVWTADFSSMRNYVESYKALQDYKKLLKEKPLKQLIGEVPETVETTEEERRELLIVCEKNLRKT